MSLLLTEADLDAANEARTSAWQRRAPRPERAQPGPLLLASRRSVYNTGRVLIGLRAGETASPHRLDWSRPQGGVSADALRLQAALLRHQAERDWLSHPAFIAAGIVVLVASMVVSAIKPWGWF